VADGFWVRNSTETAAKAVTALDIDVNGGADEPAVTDEQ